MDKIHIFEENLKLDREKLREGILDFLDVDVKFRKLEFERKVISDISELLVRIRVINWATPWWKKKVYVSEAERNFEIRWALGKTDAVGIIYDGFGLSSVFKKAFSLSSKLRASKLDLCFIITKRIIATFGDDGRYHLRVCVFAEPSIISVPGFFSAPAKPREYHLARFVSEDSVLFLADEIKERIFSSAEKIASRYVVAGLIYLNFGVGLCGFPECALSDSHTTDELLRTKLSTSLCDEHKKALELLRAKIQKQNRKSATA